MNIEELISNKSELKIIEDLELKDCFIAGGAILSLITKSEIKDFDIYCKSIKSIIDNHFILSSNSTVISFTEKSITYLMSGETSIQIIINQTYKTPEEIFNNFDYTCCMLSYDIDTKEFNARPSTIKDILSKQLVFNPKTLYPFNSLLRLSKYQRKGYSISKTELMKLMLTVFSKTEINSWDDLATEVGGIYGQQLIFNVEKDEKFSLESAITKLENLELKEIEPRVFEINDDFLYDYLTNNIKGLYKINNDENVLSSQSVYITKNNKLNYLSKNLFNFLKNKYPILDSDTTVHSIKGVRSTKDKYAFISIYKKDYKYILGQTKNEPNHPHLFVGNKYINNTYGDTLITVEFKLSDITNVDSHAINVKSLKPINYKKRLSTNNLFSKK